VSDPKIRSAGSADSLTKSANIELSESELAEVSGGDITVNKAKTADKAYQQMDAYIKQ
jgi:bacteriocin-like protein